MILILKYTIYTYLDYEYRIKSTNHQENQILKKKKKKDPVFVV